MSALGIGIDLALHGMQRRASGAAGFTPAALFTGGAAGIWYDPSDPGSMSQDADGTVPAAVGQPVGRISDKSGNVHDAVQPEAARRPLLILDEAGRPCLEGDGIDDWLFASFAVAQPWLRLSAIRQNSWTADRRIFASTVGTTGLLYQRGTAPALALHFGGTAAVTTSLAVGVAGVVTERHSGPGSQIAVGAGPYLTGSASTTPANGIALFAGTGGGLPASARCYGVVQIGRDLDEGEIALTRAFLAAKAGVAL